MMIEGEFWDFSEELQNGGICIYIFQCAPVLSIKSVTKMSWFIAQGRHKRLALACHFTYMVTCFSLKVKPTLHFHKTLFFYLFDNFFLHDNP